MSDTYQIIGRFDGIVKEDAGRALIVEPSGQESGELADGCLFVRVQSWDDDRKHVAMNKLRDKRVKVTIEIIE